MKLKNVLIASISLLFALTFASTSYAQGHKVLFENFGYADGSKLDPCGPSASFYSDVNTIFSDKSAKIIHLDYHIISLSDNMAQFCPNAGFVGAKLFPSSGGQYYDYGCVDRTILPATSAQAESYNANWAADMETQIDNQAGIAPPATMQLVSATLDKSRPENYIFTATVGVTAATDISVDSISIHYAVVEDKVIDHSNAHCSGVQTSFDDVVRFVTIGDSAVFAPNTPSGTIKNVTFQQGNLTGISGGSSIAIVNPANTRFIAFLESGGQIVNAADLKDNLNSLPAPQASLTLVNSAVDDSVFSPGDFGFPFVAINVPVVDEYYSFDNGKTWVVIADSVAIRNWPFTYIGLTLPDTEITKTGKIKVVDHNDPTIFSIQDGTFSIKVQPTLGIIHPVFDQDTLIGGSTFNIQWSEKIVNSVKLEYALDPFTNYQLIADTVTGTSYKWNVPNASIYAKLRITDDNDGTVVAISQQPFEIKKTTGSVAGTTEQNGLSITSIAPNPAENGEELIVSYTDENSPRINLEVLDLLGRVVAKQSLSGSSGGEADIPTRTLNAGAYIIRMNDGVSTVTKRVEIIR